MTDAIGKILLAVLTLLLFAGIAAYCLYTSPSEAVKQQLITAVVGWGGIAIGYFFGSSSGSASKDATIKTITTTKAP